MNSYYLSNIQNFSAIENNIKQVTPTFPWSSMSNAIIFSLSSYNGATIPSCISVNSSTGDISIVNWEVSADTDF